MDSSSLMEWHPSASSLTSRSFFVGALGLLAALTALMLAPRALANGRFPASNSILLSPTDPNEIVVRVSFGLLISRDGGKTFGWVCEQVLGLAESEDPMCTYAKSGKLVASTYQGVLVSNDRGCSWPKVASLGDKLFVDLTQRAVERERILVLESSYDNREEDGGVRYHTQLWESADDALTFTAIGPLIDPRFVGYTIDLAPSDPMRIYFSGVERLNPGSALGAIVLSTDHGTTWSAEHTVPLENHEGSLYIAAVDPKNPARIYVRTHGAADKPTRLLLSEDSGATFRTIFTSSTPLLGFALSPDGTKLYVGSPSDGLHVASTTDLAFRKTSSIAVQCITATTDRLWVCSDEKSGFIVAYSRDEGASFEGQTHFADIKGPLADCPSTHPFDQCLTTWPSLRSSLGLDRPEDAGADAADAATPPPTVLAARGGASCDAATAGTSSVLGGGLGGGGALVLLGLLRRRWRRRATAPSPQERDRAERNER